MIPYWPYSTTSTLLRSRSAPGRLLDSVTKAVETQCGIASNFGKTRAFALGVTPPPPGISELGEAMCGEGTEPIMRSARCPRPSHEGTPLRTTKLFGKRCRLAWEVPL